jgi:tetratricopeptide (TPR) repeat protein
MNTPFKSASLSALFMASIFGGVMTSSVASAGPKTAVHMTTVAVAPSNSTINSVDRVDELIGEVRALLVARHYDAAMAKIAQVGEEDGATRRAKVWELRGQMSSGFLNDILKEIDKLSAEGQGADTNYLYGMAFAAKADQALTSGSTDGTVGAYLVDSQSFLAQALEHDSDKYDDAYVVLSKMAWMNRDLPASIDAADLAVRAYPKDGVAWVQRGKAQLSQYTTISGDEARKEELEALGKDMIKSFQTGLALLPTDKANRRVNEHAEGWKQLGDANLWLSETAAAATAYAEAMGWDPSKVDFGQLWNTFPMWIADGTSFISCLDAGKGHYEKRYGNDTPFDATLLWWLGYARFMSGEKSLNAVGQEELLASVEKRRDFGNAYYYVMHMRFAAVDYDGATDILLKFWEIDPAGTVATIANDLATAKPIIEFLVGQCTRGRLLDAAVISEIMANADKPGDRHWSYKALFLRDYADGLIRMDRKNAEKEEVMAYYEQSLKAYERALEISPKDPNYMNDLAVVLDYNLGRELERALALYEEAFTISVALMDDPMVDQDLKDLFYSIARRDSANNAKRLRRQLERAKKDDKESSSDE